MDSLASLDGQKSMSFLTEINRIYWCVIWTHCSGRLLGNCAVQKTLTEISTASILTTVTLWIEIVLLLSLRWLCWCPCAFFAGLQWDDTVSFIWQDEASSIILPWKPRLANPPFPVPVAALPNDAQIDTTAPPLFPPLFSLSIYVKEPSVQFPWSCFFPQMPPSLWEYQINEIDLSFLVIHQLLCLFHACPKCIQECPATLIPVDQWCNIHFCTPISL